MTAIRPVHPDSTLAWSRAPAGTDEQWSLTWTGEGFRFRAHDDRRGLHLDLEAVPSKPVVFQGPGGFSRKSGSDSTAASLYYSYTRLETTGTVTLDGEAVAGGQVGFGGGHRVEALLLAAGEGDGGSGVGTGMGDRLADATAGSGDDDDTVGEGEVGRHGASVVGRPSPW